MGSSAPFTTLERKTSLKRKSLDGAGRGAFILERSTSRQRLSKVSAETQSSSSSSRNIDDGDNNNTDEDENTSQRNYLKKEEQQQQQQQDCERKQLIRLKSFQNAIQMIHSLPSQVEQKEK